MTEQITSSMKPYQEWVVQNIFQFCSLEKINALEIGGVPTQCGIADRMLDEGATRVVQVNNRKDLPVCNDKPLQYFPMDARNLDFADSSFDVIFSASELEHLLDLDKVLTELHRVVKPGGLVCLHRGAFWNCAWGHHVWVHTDGEKYEFNGNNPLPNWSHLYLDRSDMSKMLIENGLPSQHVNKIVSWVFDSDEINRLTYDNFVDIFNKSEFGIVSLTHKNWKLPDTEILNRLRSLHGNKISNYSIGEAVVVLRKKNKTSKKPDKILRAPTTIPDISKDSNNERPSVGEACSVKNGLALVYEHLAPIHNDRFENVLEHLYTIFVNEGDNVVDIGAHAGRHTFPMAKAVGATGSVLAFEPLPNMFENLKTEIENRELSNVVKLAALALSNRQGAAEFLAVENAPGLSGLKERTSHEGQDVNKIDVQIDLLDNVVRPETKITFVKVDAEGADFHILQGARRVLDQDRPLVVFESGRINSFPAESYSYSEQEFLDYFHSINYVLYDIAGFKYSPEFWNKPTLNDFVAIPAEKATEYRELLLVAVLTEFAK